MSRLEKYRLVLLTCVTILGLGLCLYLIYATQLKANNQHCHELLMQPVKNADFFVLLEKLSAKHSAKEITEKGYTTQDTGRDKDIRAIILNIEDVKKIYENPKKYFADVIKVIASPDFDQSQKMYSIIMMQKLPIKDYMCVMDTANTAYKYKIITDKQVMVQAINPNINMASTTIRYWWLPDWQQRFNKYAKELFSQQHIEEVLNGNYRKIMQDASQ